MKLKSTILQSEIQLRERFKEKIFEIIKERCNLGSGRVGRGVLQAYIYYKLGFYGRISNQFTKMLNSLLIEFGFRPSYLVSKRCFCGLSWKGESKKDWYKPKAKDLPQYNGRYHECDVDHLLNTGTTL